MFAPPTRVDILQISDRGIDCCGDRKRQACDDSRKARVMQGEDLGLESVVRQPLGN